MWIHSHLQNGREEMACDEAEVGADEFTERTRTVTGARNIYPNMTTIMLKVYVSKAPEVNFIFQQLLTLKRTRKFPMDDQSAILEKVCWLFIISSLPLDQKFGT